MHCLGITRLLNYMNKLTLILLFLFSVQSNAQQSENIQYVTGKLYLSLYQQADGGSSVLKSLVSGDRLVVLEIAGPYARVTTETGLEGWVKKGFLVKSKPASILYKEVNVAYESLQKEVASFNERNSLLLALESKLELISSENNTLKTSIEKYKKEQQGTQNQAIDKNAKNIDLEGFKQFISEYLFFCIALVILLLLIGFRAGEIKTESEVIKHFGGVKVW